MRTFCPIREVSPALPRCTYTHPSLSLCKSSLSHQLSKMNSLRAMCTASLHSENINSLKFKMTIFTMIQTGIASFTEKLNSKQVGRNISTQKILNSPLTYSKIGTNTSRYNSEIGWAGYACQRHYHQHLGRASETPSGLLGRCLASLTPRSPSTPTSCNITPNTDKFTAFLFFPLFREEITSWIWKQTLSMGAMQ